MEIGETLKQIYTKREGWGWRTCYYRVSDARTFKQNKLYLLESHMSRG
jgi:hypothetical protein